MNPGTQISGRERLTDDDMDRINADIRIQPSKFSGWFLLAAFAACCLFWYGMYKFVVR